MDKNLFSMSSGASEWAGERVNERLSAAERVSEAGCAEKANGCAVQVNKRADE